MQPAGVYGIYLRNQIVFNGANFDEATVLLSLQRLSWSWIVSNTKMSSGDIIASLM